LKNESNNFSLIPNLPSSTLFLSLSVINVLNTSLGTITLKNSGTIDTITSTGGTNNKIVGNQNGVKYNDLVINEGTRFYRWTNNAG